MFSLISDPTAILDADHTVDVAVLIICVVLLIAWAIITMMSRLGKQAKSEDAWMEDHLRETTKPTGREDGR
jgi:hypothetical protein